VRALARDALVDYGLGGAELRLLKYSWNTVFRVDAPSGERYVLRVSRPGVRDLLDIESELAWMDALARETDIVVPAPIRTKDGELVTRRATAGVPEPRHVALFEWVGGRHAVRSPSERVIALLGETMACMHDHADTFVPPAPFTTRRFDRLGSFSAGSQIHADEPHPLLDGGRLSLFRREAARVQAELDRLFGGPARPLFLHQDLHLGNVKLLDGRLAVLDFDDSMWGYPVQDIGISLYYLRYLRGFAPELREHFKRGYCRIREWPEEWPGQIDLMIEARAFDLIDVLLTLDHPQIRANLPRYIEGIENQVRELSSRTGS
jgi:Ser/Thr protein kinase RdoA (MazF antagonist)